MPAWPPTAGVEAIALSNHGGRQLDGAPATLDLVAPVADAVGGPGRDHLRRRHPARQRHRQGRRSRRRRPAWPGGPILYGLGAAGERGVDRLLRWFRADLLRTMTLLGAATIGDLDRSLLGPASATSL